VAGKGHEFKALFRAGPDVFNGVPNGVTAEGCVHVTINFHGNSLGDESDNCMSNVLKKSQTPTEERILDRRSMLIKDVRD
jgi:hypothetical protein